MRTIFTTGQVAKICKVAPRTVSKWFDSGRLRGYRIPGSQDRRIPRDHLVRFLKEHGMPLGELEEDMSTVLVVGDVDVQSIREALQERLGEGVKLSFADSAFDAGVLCNNESAPNCIIVDASVGQQSLANFGTNESLSKSVLIALLPKDVPSPVGFTECFHKPYDLSLLAERVNTHLKRSEEAAAVT